MKTTILALGLLFALNAHAAIPTGLSVSGTVTAVKAHSIEIDGKSYPIDVQSNSELANVRPGDKISFEYSPANTAGAPQQVQHPVNKGIEVVNSANVSSGVAQAHGIRLTRAR